MILVTRPGRRFHKEALLDLLWPNENPDVTIGRLHTAISRLRRSLAQSGLGDESVVFENDGYFVSPRISINSDVLQYESHATEGIQLASRDRQGQAIVELEKAASLYRGPYLEEIVGEDWPILERTRLENLHLETLSRLAVLHFGEANLPSCVSACERLLQLDDLREDTCRVLMQAHFIMGSRVKAIRAYRDLELALERELSVEPDRETRQLFARIRGP